MSAVDAEAPPLWTLAETSDELVRAFCQEVFEVALSMPHSPSAVSPSSSSRRGVTAATRVSMLSQLLSLVSDPSVGSAFWGGGSGQQNHGSSTNVAKRRYPCLFLASRVYSRTVGRETDSSVGAVAPQARIVDVDDGNPTITPKGHSGTLGRGPSTKSTPASASLPTTEAIVEHAEFSIALSSVPKPRDRFSRDEAATKIQAVHRGHMARKEHRERVRVHGQFLDATCADDEPGVNQETDCAAANDGPDAEDADAVRAPLPDENVDGSPIAQQGSVGGLTPAKPKGYQTHLVYRRLRDASPSHQLEETLARTNATTAAASVHTVGVTTQQQPPVASEALKPVYVPKRPGVLPGISKHKPVKVEDPIVQALEAKIRERRNRERQRQEETRKKQQMIQAEFERRQQEIEAEQHHKRMEALRLAREASERRAEEMRELERQRQERLSKLLKADMDVITGKKNIVAAFAERFEEQQARLEQERQEALRKRHEQFGARGEQFYRELHEHERKVMEEKARQQQRQQTGGGGDQPLEARPPAPLPPSHHPTRAHRRILAEKKERLAQEQAEEERIRARLDQMKNFAEDVRHNRSPQPHGARPARNAVQRKPSKKQIIGKAFAELGQKRKSSVDAIRRESSTRRDDDAEPEMSHQTDAVSATPQDEAPS